jgi:hypothetical protein
MNRQYFFFNQQLVISIVFVVVIVTAAAVVFIVCTINDKLFNFGYQFYCQICLYIILMYVIVFHTVMCFGLILVSACAYLHARTWGHATWTLMTHKIFDCHHCCSKDRQVQRCVIRLHLPQTQLWQLGQGTHTLLVDSFILVKQI